jgi:hypothetical protein
VRTFDTYIIQVRIILLFKLSENHSVLLGLFHLNRAMLVELYVIELIATISFGTPSL